MAAKRRPPIHQQNSFNSGKQNGPNLNFRPTFAETKAETKGTKPTTPPPSVKEIFTLMILHVCRKSLFFDTNLKVCIYLGSLFLVSLIADFTSVPRTYLARSDNVFNQYFVKFAWGWNLVLMVPYVVLTAYIYCCEKKDVILKNHLLRIGIATFFWYIWTSLFNLIENTYGRCNVKGAMYNSKQSCLKAGHFWNGFDISGHSFILIYGSLMLIEESRSIMNWDSIKEMTRQEVHLRQNREKSIDSPLRQLSDQEVFGLEKNFEKYTPYIRGIFITITLFQILWDVMLICTMLYHHVMIEKFLGGVFAILTWFFTYRFWYALPKMLPGLPGEGSFKYNKTKSQSQNQVPLSARKRSSLANNGAQGPKFMGMPIYTSRQQDTASDSSGSQGPGPSGASQLINDDFAAR